MSDLVGFSWETDAHWILDTGEFIVEIAEYNQELTGFDLKLHELDPHVFHYGGNAYYILGQYAREKGWRVWPKLKESQNG